MIWLTMTCFAMNYIACVFVYFISFSFSRIPSYPTPFHTTHQVSICFFNIPNFSMLRSFLWKWDYQDIRIIVEWNITQGRSENLSLTRRRQRPLNTKLAQRFWENSLTSHINPKLSLFFPSRSFFNQHHDIILFVA
jgi:hypothetical protein